MGATDTVRGAAAGAADAAADQGAAAQVYTMEDSYEVNPPRLPAISVYAMPMRARQFRLPKTFASLQHRNYRLYFMGQIPGTAGSWMQTIAQAWLVYELSQSELALGVVGFAAAIPSLFVSPFAGVVVDRVNKRNLLMLSQIALMLISFTLFALTFSGVIQVWQVVALAVLSGVAVAFDSPTRQAIVVEMVGRRELPNALALNSMLFNSARIVGPAVGGVLLVAVGPAWCFFINGVSFVAVLASLLMMRMTKREQVADTKSAWARLKSGVDYAVRTEEVKGLLVMAAVFSTFGMSYPTILPAFVDKALGQGAEAYGAVNALTGVGAVTGAFFLANYGDRGKRGRLLSAAALVFPIVLALFALNRIYPVALGLAVFMGMSFMLTFVNINTLLQTRVPDDMRGRILSLYTLSFAGFAPFGNLLIGSLSQRWGLTPAILTSATLSFVGVALVLWRVGKIRKLD